MTAQIRGRVPNHALSVRLDRGLLTKRVDFCGIVVAIKDPTCTIPWDQNAAEQHAKLTVAGAIGAVGR